MPMVYLFYGDDTYRSKQKVHQLMRKYVDSNLGDTNLARLDGATESVDTIIRQIFAEPFLAPKRLVIIENLLLNAPKPFHESMLQALEKVPSTTVLLFWEKGTPDRRTKLFQTLNQPKRAEVFAPLEGYALTQWVQAFFKQKAVPVTSTALDGLTKRVGPDLWRMENECRKLAASADDRGVTIELVDDLIADSTEISQFSLLDALFDEHPEGAISFYYQMSRFEDSPLPTLALINSTLSRLMMIKDWSEKGMPLPTIISQGKIHPFQARKLSGQARQLPWDRLKRWQESLIEIDAGIKSGKLEPTQAMWTLVAVWFGSQKLAWLS